jgi:succinyl-diaminopimelate desuccinylase
LEILAAYTPRVVVLEGCSFKEALQAVKVYGGVASNVVPDEVVLTFNYRFAPDRGTQEAVAYLEGLFDRWLDPEMGDSLEVKEVVGGAMPQLDNPFLNKLVSESRLPPRGKLGWTDVAFFAERGIPAANFGPGDPDLAHTPHEYVERSSLEAARAVLGSLIASPK